MIFRRDKTLLTVLFCTCMLLSVGLISSHHTTGVAHLDPKIGDTERSLIMEKAMDEDHPENSECLVPCNEEPDGLSDLIIGNNGRSSGDFPIKTTLSGEYRFRKVEVYSGGLLETPAFGRLRLVADSIHIHEGGSVIGPSATFEFTANTIVIDGVMSVDGMDGEDAGTGSTRNYEEDKDKKGGSGGIGAGENGDDDFWGGVDAGGGGGGGYGGEGGEGGGYIEGDNSSKGGITYGNDNGSGIHTGSGGGNGGRNGMLSGASGGNGGGVINYTASHIEITGVVSANGGKGGSGFVATTSTGGGGGSGGGILLNSSFINLLKNGSIKAVGGGGGYGLNGRAGGGGGGGGRIKIFGVLTEIGTISAKRGGGGLSEGKSGKDGTIFIEDVNTPPFPSKLESPFSGAWVNGTPTFVWSFRDPEWDDVQHGYNVQLSKNISFIHLEINVTEEKSNISSWKPKKPLTDGTKYWRVRTKDAQIWGDYSDIWTIKVEGDGDGIIGDNDSFPTDPAASKDTDGDGYPDEWNSGKGHSDSTSTPPLELDAYPNDHSRWKAGSPGGGNGNSGGNTAEDDDGQNTSKDGSGGNAAACLIAAAVVFFIIVIIAAVALLIMKKEKMFMFGEKK